MSKKYFIFVLLLVVAGALVSTRLSGRPSILGSSAKNISVEQTVDGKSDGRISVPAGMTALGLLQIRHQVEKQGEGGNAFVTGIDGRKAETANKEFWSYYVNGQLAPVGAGSYQLKNNDRILWKIDTY